jgi:hypothetical protein
MTQEPRDWVVALNLYVLQTLCQIAKEEPAEAMIRFGVGKEVAVMLSGMNVAEIFEISRSPTFLFRIDQDGLLGALKDRKTGVGYNGIHDAIVNMAALMKEEEAEDV